MFDPASTAAHPHAASPEGPRTPPLALSDRPADASSRRSALLVLCAFAGLFLALAPFARVQLPPAAWFIPLFQSVLIINDLVTAALLFGQLWMTRQRASLVLAAGYVFAALMAAVHLLSFPAVFAPGGLLGAGPQTTGYLHVFWHLGLPLAALAYTRLRQDSRPMAPSPGRAAASALLVVAALVLALTLVATIGQGALPPMLEGNQYSSAFNIGRYGQWAVTGAAALLLWRSGLRSSLDVWLVVMLCDSFFEIALVSIVNSGRYDLGFYAGRVYAVAGSCVVLVMLLVEHGKMYFELARARETERSEAALRDSRQVLRLAMHGGQMAAWSHEPGATFWSAEVEALTGWPAAALASRDFLLERVHPDDRCLVTAALETSDTLEPEFGTTFRLRHADGEWRWLHLRGQVEPAAGQRSARLFGVVSDVTELRRSEQAVTHILESITDGFFAIDQEWRFTYVNGAAEQLLRRRREDLLGRDLREEFPPSYSDVFLREYERAIARGGAVSFESYYQPLSMWVEVRAFPNSNGLAVYFHDATARKEAERRLRESEESHRLLADMIPQFIWATDPDGYHNYFSRRWFEFTGTSPGETHGEGWAEFLHPDDRPRMEALWRHSLLTGEPYSIEYRFRRADGSYTWFWGQAEPMRDEAGRIVRWFGTLTDITDRKQLEEERERRLETEKKARRDSEHARAELERVTESRARLMRGFSHDLRNPLAAADGNAMLLEDGRAAGPLTDKQLERVRRIRRGIRTSLGLIDDLLDLAQAEAGQIDLERVDVDVDQVAREIAEDFHAQAAAAGVDMELQVPRGVHAHADPQRVRQVLANLVSNAIKYAPHSHLAVRAALRPSGGPAPGSWIGVSVSDGGPGIPADKRELIFEEYTRLDPGAQQGAGIGLSISRRIARLMGGDLTVDSEPGRGSTFTLWIPAAESQEAVAVL